MYVHVKTIAKTIILSSIGALGSRAGAFNEVSLIDFATRPPVAQENLNVRIGEDYILTGLNARSTTLAKVSRTSEASVTYDLNPPFKFEDFPGYELNLWLHVDGLPAVVPGPNPFFGETHPYVVNVDLLDANDNFVYRTRATRIVSRGWNELKFALISGDPTGEHVSPGFPIRRRAYHFDRVGGPGQTVRKARIRFDGNDYIGKIRLNSLRLKKVDKCQVVMVFDDGYKGVYDNVAPALREETSRPALRSSAATW